jgi:cytochrome P450
MVAVTVLGEGLAGTWRTIMAATFDLSSDAFFEYPYSTYEQMRRTAPVYLDPRSGAYFVTRYQDVQAVCRDQRMSASRVERFFLGLGPELAEEIEQVRRFLSPWIVFLNPPAHGRLRTLISRAFTPRRIAALTEFVQHCVSDALERVAGQDQFDVIAELSEPVPAQVITHILGVAPADAHKFKEQGNLVFRVPSLTGDPVANVRAADQGARWLEEYFRELIAVRRARPVDDLLGSLVHANEDGQMLTEQELVSTAALLMIAGHETTTNQIGNATLALLDHPDELARLRADPTLIDSAVEEFFRYEDGGGTITRIATADVEFSDTLVPAGSVIMAPPQAANRDAEVFDEPDRLDLGRPNNRHLAFGVGIHTCVGASLARLELAVTMSTLVRRFPELSLPRQTFDWKQSFAERGVRSLVVRTGVRQPALH